MGAVAALVACGLLINKGFGVLSGWQLAGVSLYGASLIVLFSASTLYHAVHVDHAAVADRHSVARDCLVFGGRGHCTQDLSCPSISLAVTRDVFDDGLARAVRFLGAVASLAATGVLAAAGGRRLLRPVGIHVIPDA